MKYFVTFITALLISTNALASSYSTLSLGTSYFYEDNPSYSTDFELKPTLAFSHFVEVNKKHHIVAGFSTNRLDNILVERRSYRVTFKDGSEGVNKQKITYDAACGGKRFKKWLPMACALNTRVDNQFFRHNLSTRMVNHAILFSLNMNYIISNEYTVSLNYILANKELHLKGGLSASFNYNF